MSQDERECSRFNFAICLPKDQLTLVKISCHALNKQFFPWLRDQESWKKNTKSQVIHTPHITQLGILTSLGLLLKHQVMSML